jgi:hypothetical protein
MKADIDPEFEAQVARSLQVLHGDPRTQPWPAPLTRVEAVVRHQNRVRVSLGAVGLATAVAAAVVGIGVATSAGPRTVVPGGRMSSGAVPDPIYSGFLEVGDSAPGPADLVAVTLPDSVPAAQLVPGSETYSREGGHWVKFIGLFRPGLDLSAGVVIVTKASVQPPRNPASPSPAVAALTVAGRPATSWVSGGDHWVFFTAGQFTVEVYASDKTVTTTQMIALADALQGLPK